MTSKQQKLNSLLDLTKHFPDEKSCREHLAKIRWGKKMACVHCGNMKKIYRINDGKLFRCADCGKQFTVRVGTIFEDSALPLQKWFMAIYIFMAHKKGISSVQLGKDIAVTQKTAWHMLHRIRHAVRTKSFDKLSGIVEVDETYLGAPKRGHSGRDASGKTIVFGMKERNGQIRAQVVNRVNGETLKPIIRENVDKETVIMSDEHGGYYGLKDEFKGHEVVKHGRKEYARGNVHVNNIESFWALFKRGYVGTYHWMSGKHMDKYIDEFEFRLNSKDITDPMRFDEMLQVCEGRLTYEELIARS